MFLMVSDISARPIERVLPSSCRMKIELLGIGIIRSLFANLEEITLIVAPVSTNALMGAPFIEVEMFNNRQTGRSRSLKPLLRVTQ